MNNTEGIVIFLGDQRITFYPNGIKAKIELRKEQGFSLGQTVFEIDEDTWTKIGKMMRWGNPGNH